MTTSAVATDESFLELVEPLRRELTAHCYRMSGSVHDAEDLVQETYLRAWRSFHGFENRSSLRTWMYQIATNVCLTALQTRARRPLPTGLGQPSSDPRGQLESRPEVSWLEPLPDAVLWGSGHAVDPAEAVVGKEGIRLAFVAALQHLTPQQRAVLIFRDVLAWHATEVAAILGLTVAGVNSTLQRARAQVASLTPDDPVEPVDDGRAAALLQGYVDAFESYDVDRIVELLTLDVIWQMPPFTGWYQGNVAVGQLIAAQCPAQGPGDMRLVPTAANGQPAFAVYLRDECGVHRAFQIQQLTLSAAGVSHVTAYFDVDLFAYFRVAEHALSQQEASAPGGRTPWAWRDTPLRAFIRTETGSAALLLAVTVAALVWVGLAPETYESVWSTPLSIRLGGVGVGQDLRGWVNNGLMTFFFFVIGLEARRSLDIGDLRERSRVLLPLLAGLGGMVASVGIYLVANGGSAARGWGIAMSTDTAFALGLLSLAAAKPLQPLRSFLLTVVVVDDVVALLVIATVYSDRVEVVPLAIALAVFGAAWLALRLRVRVGPLYLLLGAGAWLGLFVSGLDPLIIGLAMGLLTYAFPVGRTALEQATEEFRLFREQPTSELARSASQSLRSALSPNERLQALYHPWTSYVIVPLFALANAGIAINPTSLAHAIHSPIAVGVVTAYVVGKPVGIVATSWLVRLASGGRLRPPVGWAVLGGGASAGIGFTVSLLIATLAFSGADLEAAKLGILASALGSALLTALVFRIIAWLPSAVRTRAVFGDLPPLTDLSEPVDPERDHVRGLVDAPITLLEYGDLECPFCGRAEPAVRDLLACSEDVRYVWRHLPLIDVHPHAQLAAEASEAAARQDRFWEMHDLLLSHQDALESKHLSRYAEQLELDVGQFRDDLRRHSLSARIADDVESAASSGVLGTPTFFVNGRRHHGTYDVTALLAAVQEARARPTDS